MDRRVACRFTCTALLAAGFLLETPARADQVDDPYAQPRLPAPFMLPSLAHPRTDLGWSWLTGLAPSRDPGRTASAIGLVRGSLESNIVVPRRLYVGVTSHFASALVADAPGAGGVRSALGNVEPHVRGVFPLTDGIAFGFHLGTTLPTATFGRHGDTQSAMLAAASLEPTDYVQFLPGRLAFRPAGDMRIVAGRFVFQVRQGVDLTFDVAGTHPLRTAGRLLGHIGYVPRRWFEASIEASQIYFFFTEELEAAPDASLAPDVRAAEVRRIAQRERYRISDERRTAFTVGPALRFAFRTVDVGVQLVTNVLSPLSPPLDSFVAGRVSLVAHFR